MIIRLLPFAAALLLTACGGNTPDDKAAAVPASASTAASSCSGVAQGEAREDCKFHNAMTLEKRTPYKRAPVVDPLLGRSLAAPASATSAK